MSLRAIKKRENLTNTNQSANTRPMLFKKSTVSTQQRKGSHIVVVNSLSAEFPQHKARLGLSRGIYQQKNLLGRNTYSNPELQSPVDTLERFAAAHSRLVRTKSESDVTTTLLNNREKGVNEIGLNSAKSEVCLQTISSHTVDTNNLNKAERQKERNYSQTHYGNMISGARSHRDLTQSSYSGSLNRRMSESSFNSNGGYSYETNAMSASDLTLSSSVVESTTNAVIRVPIIGYEVMEERARFTVYKLRVENPLTNDCWLVLRRYTDFVRLNSKLKQAFPQITLTLPRKKIFGDNFNAVFLDHRVQGLQMFVNSIMAKEELRKSKMVRDFFCLDEPPSYSESMEECRAIFEAQEETIAHLKLQINNKDDLILSLQQKLREEIAEKEQLKEVTKNKKSCTRCSAANNTIS